MTTQTASATVGQAQISIDVCLFKHFAEFIVEFDDNPLKLGQYIVQVGNTFLKISKAAHKFVFMLHVLAKQQFACS